VGRKFEIVESEDTARPGTFLIWGGGNATAIAVWIRVDGTFGDGNETSSEAYEAYYHPSREAAETVLIAAKIRGDAL
jgi:hypothetical protein